MNILQILKQLRDDLKTWVTNNLNSINTKLNNKVDREVGKGLSTNDFTDEYKSVLDNLGESTQPDWNQNDETAPDYIKNRTHYDNSTESIINIQPTGSETQAEVRHSTYGSYDDYYNYDALYSVSDTPTTEFDSLLIKENFGYDSANFNIEKDMFDITTYPGCTIYKYTVGNESDYYARTVLIAVVTEPGKYGTRLFFESGYNNYDIYADKAGVYIPLNTEIVNLKKTITDIKTLDEKFIPDTIVRKEELAKLEINSEKNWDENDPNSNKYIKNRTHYKEKIDIRWDEGDYFSIELHTPSYGISINLNYVGSFKQNNADFESLYNAHNMSRYSKDTLTLEESANCSWYKTSPYESEQHLAVFIRQPGTYTTYYYYWGSANSVSAYFPNAGIYLSNGVILEGYSSYKTLDENFIPDSIARVVDIPEPGTNIPSKSTLSGSSGSNSTFSKSDHSHPYISPNWNVASGLGSIENKPFGPIAGTVLDYAYPTQDSSSNSAYYYNPVSLGDQNLYGFFYSDITLPTSFMIETGEIISKDSCSIYNLSNDAGYAYKYRDDIVMIEKTKNTSGTFFIKNIYDVASYETIILYLGTANIWLNAQFRFEMPVPCIIEKQLDEKYIPDTIARTSSLSNITAKKLETAREFQFGTAIETNKVSFDGSKNVNIDVNAVYESYLKWGGKSISCGISPIDAATSQIHSANRFAFANPAGVIVEYSNDNGSSWIDYNCSNEEKTKLFSGIGANIRIGKKEGTAKATVDDKLRITLLNTMGTYTALKKILINMSSEGSTGNGVYVEMAYNGSETDFFEFGKFALGGWSDWNSLPLEVNFGGSSEYNIGAIRLTFEITGVNDNYTSAMSILDIVGIGTTYWSSPSTLAKTGHLYSYDYQQNAIFPANITAIELRNTSGNAISLPSYTDADEGKILQIVNGKPTWVSLPKAEEATF